MFSNWWADPSMAVLLLIGLLCVSGIVAALVTVVQEARRARVVTAEELRRDAFTAERRAKLKILQGRFGRRAS